jgi:hypothetical protein
MHYVESNFSGFHLIVGKREGSRFQGLDKPGTPAGVRLG